MATGCFSAGQLQTAQSVKNGFIGLEEVYQQATVKYAVFTMEKSTGPASSHRQLLLIFSRTLVIAQK